MNDIPGKSSAYLPFLIAGWVALVASNLFMPGVAVTDWFQDSSVSADIAAAQGLFPQAEAAVAAAPVARLPAAKPRCEECGVIDSYRPIAATGSSPATYEITLRMRDGSMRVLNDAGPASLRPGDHITLIGGLNPSTR